MIIIIVLIININITSIVFILLCIWSNINYYQHPSWESLRTNRWMDDVGFSAEMDLRPFTHCVERLGRTLAELMDGFTLF